MKYVLLALRICTLDQTAKQLVRDRVVPGESVEVIKDKLYIENVKNKGAAYGLLGNNPKVLFAVTAAVVGWFISVVRGLFKEKGMSEGEKLSLACMAGGAMGNMVDRLCFKEVTDFIHIKFSKKAPVFNMADVFILVGAVTFVCRQIFSKKG